MCTKFLNLIPLLGILHQNKLLPRIIITETPNHAYYQRSLLTFSTVRCKERNGMECGMEYGMEYGMCLVYLLEDNCDHAGGYPITL